MEKIEIDNYGKLAVTIIEEFDADKEESGRSAMKRSLEFLLEKYDNEHDFEVISDTLCALTGYSLETLAEKSKEVDLDEEDDF